MPNPIHHIHKRKLVTKNNDPYPHPDKLKRYLDHLVYFFGVIGPLTGAVQAYKIWQIKDATGVSLTMFVFGVFNDMVWMTYGVIHKQKPIVLMYTLWLMVNLTVVAGILIYG